MLATQPVASAQVQPLPRDGHFGWRQPSYRDSWPGIRTSPSPRIVPSVPYREPLPPVDRYVPGPLPVAPPYQNRIDALPTAHFAWCQARYRSYRPGDNSFQPFEGPRRACLSPFM